MMYCYDTIINNIFFLLNFEVEYGIKLKKIISELED